MSDTYAVLRLRDVRLFFAAKLFITLGLQMQLVVMGWQIYTLTHDPLALGLIGLAEALPYMSCLLWAGHQTDLSEKRRIIVLSQAGLLGCALALLALALAHVSIPWPIYLVIGVSGICRSFLWPSSSAYLDTTVPKEIYSQAAGWNSTLWQMGAIVGPMVGGLVYAIGNAAWAYGGVSVFLAIGILISLRMNPRPPGHVPGVVSSGRTLLQGIRFVFARQPLWAAMSLDMFAVLFGGAVALLPIFAERMQVGSAGLGMLNAAPAAGALVMSVYQSHRPPFSRTGRAMLTGVFLFGLCMILFPLSHWFWLSWFLLAGSGAADNVSVVIRASIIQGMTPNHLRGRVSSVNGFFISSSNEIGAFESGVAAKLLGVVPSIILGGLLTWVCVFVTAWKAPELRRLRLREEHPSRR